METGVHEVEIVNNTVTELGDKPAVKLIVRFNDESEADVVIWLTEKAAGIARKQLKTCGFDVDSRDLSELADNPNALGGRRITVIVEEYNGKLRAQIPLNSTPPKKEMKRLSGILRAAKNRDEDPPETAKAAAPADEDEGSIPF